MRLLSRREPITEFTLENPQKKMRIGEQDTSRGMGLRFKDGLRSLGRRWSFRRNFWSATPSFEGSQLNYERCRLIYRNDDRQTNLGTGFGKRIINSTVDFMGVPHCATGDSAVDEFLNEGLQTFWNAELHQMVRNACRDSKTIVRYRRDDIDNPLITTDEWAIGYLELYEPEEVEIYYDTKNGRRIERAYIRHRVELKDEDVQDVDGTQTLQLPRTREHIIVEEITPERYRYFDESDGEWKNDWELSNDWGFVALVEVFNEFDSTLDGGQSDFEGPLPFMLAFHDVMAQTLQAHKYHSIPKVKFNVKDVMTFIANNWPDSFEMDANGQPKMDTFSGEINFKGTEIFFFQEDEDGGFIEATSVLGDSKTLMEWLLECISIASETPTSILMNAKTQDQDEMVPFTRKIERKRNLFETYIQVLCKMALSVNAFDPVRPHLTWEDVDPQQSVTRSQALQQDSMSLEVARTAKVISDDTVRGALRRHLPGMKSNEQERRDAKSNEIPPDMLSSGSVAPNSKDKGKNE